MKTDIDFDLLLKGGMQKFKLKTQQRSTKVDRRELKAPDGSWEFEAIFDSVVSNDDGTYLVRINDSYGILGRDGKWVLKCKYNCIYTPCEDLYPVRVDWGDDVSMDLLTPMKIG